jgi:hypothetical protein
VIVGQPHTGRVLSSAAGAWLANRPGFERRWLRCGADGSSCAPIPGATVRWYAPTAEDLGHPIQLEVTARVSDVNQQRQTTALSAQTPPITDPTPKVKISKPKKLKPRKKLKVPAAIDGYFDLGYEWLRKRKPIKRETKRTHKLTRRDLGKKISCRLTLTPDGGGDDLVITTKAVKVPKPKRRR